ncbi:MAG: hypothetical protein Q7W51_08340 [Coriobacteriia bacterium]|nr:hypothetical protein [Coriobacteriia bacterium]
MRPFAEGDTFTFFRSLEEGVRREIDALDNDYVLNASPSELEQHFVSKGTISPLVIHADDYYMASNDSAKIDVSNDFLRGGYGDGRPIVIAGTRLTIAIPFEGDAKLWRIRASTFSMGGYPEIDLVGGEVRFGVTFPDDSANADTLRRQIDGHVKSLVTAVDYLANDVAKHNQSMRSMVPAAIESKRAKALTATNAVASLGIPMKRSEQPPTFTLPLQRRPTPITRPKVATGKYEPEPLLARAEYDHILTVMRSMSLVIERNPASFGDLSEEAIRDHFLLQLNGHYQGGATGETFNASGKTDILLRSGDRNVFIAECKFWRGTKGFSDAVDQLLGYLTWRDSKTALVVFNRNRDTAGVRAKMHAAIEARPEWVKTLVASTTGDSSYALVKPSDPGREILLTTQLYDVPAGTSD